MVWIVRLSTIGLIAVLLLIAASRSEAKPGVGLEYARASSKTVFAGEAVSLLFELRGTGTRDLRVQVIRKGAGIVSEIEAPALPPTTPLAVDWSGLNANGKPAKPGSYTFKLRLASNARAAGGAKVSMKGVRGRRSFKVRKAPTTVFPIRGTYTFGDGFGAARSGHSHQGQDVFASCGAPLVSPEPGAVVARAFQASAGNYVVVRLAASGQDAVFMHLQKPSWAQVGTPVTSGQQIGRVGQTGNAQGCHLHFELWTAPGWYRGGAPYDPLPTLRAWE